MPLLSKYLFIRRSLIPKAGRGLFTKAFIPKSSTIIEYTGKVKTWKDITSDTVFNAYVFYINRNYVIDAKDKKTMLARYINDARGLTRMTDFRNNCRFETVGLKVYIVATKDIPAGSELFVGYGADYWKAVRYNQS